MKTKKAILILFAMVGAFVVEAWAFPTWMGVYGDFQRYDGGNPGQFTVLMNRDYVGLQTQVGVRIDGGGWTLHSMTYAGHVDGNSMWTHTLAGELSPGAVVDYFFTGFDSAGNRIWDSNGGQNYSFEIEDTYSAPTWLGVYGAFDRHSGENPGTFTVLVNRNHYEGLIVGVGYKIPGQEWRFERMEFQDDHTRNSVWTHSPAEAFVAPSEVQYYFHAWDTRGTRLWDSNDGQNYVAAFSQQPPTWMGVFDGYERHNGENPGLFTILVNRPYYPGLQAGIGFRVNEGSWEFQHMDFHHDLERDSVWTWEPSAPFVAPGMVDYFFHAWDDSGVGVWDSANGQNYRIDLEVVPNPTNMYLTVNNFHSGGRQTNVVLQTILEVPMEPVEGLRAGLRYYMNGAWRTRHFPSFWVGGDDAWVVFSDLFPIEIEGVCDQMVEYYVFVTDDRGFYFTKGTKDKPLEHEIQLTLHRGLPYRLFSNGNLGLTNQHTRSLAYTVPANHTVAKYRHKILPDDGFSDWLYTEEDPSQFFAEVPRGAGIFTSVVEAVSVFGCSATQTNIVGVISDPLAFIPDDGMTDRLWDQLLEIMPENPTESDRELFTYYNRSTPVVWADNWTTNFDLSGIGWERAQAGTLISPKHVLGAAHLPRGPGQTIIFHDRYGERHSRQIVRHVINDTVSDHYEALYPYPQDVQIYELNEPLPDTVKWYKILPPTFRYRDVLIGAPVLITNHKREMLIRNISFAGPGLRHHPTELVPSVFGIDLIIGDSGNPTFLYIDGDLVLVSTHTTNSDGPFFSNPNTYSGLVHLFKMLTTDEEITLFDLHGWGEYLD